MESDSLSRIIEAEKDIARIIEEERKKALQLVEQTKIDAAKRLAEERGSLSAALEAAIRNAEADAEKTASELLDKACKEAERLSGISNEEVNALLKKHLCRILPETAGQKQ